MFIGRNEELDYLNKKYNNSKSEFIVIYGRRRIGKTALIKEFVKEKSHIFYSAVQITDKVQLKKMSSVVTNHFEVSIYNTMFSDWEMLFEFIVDNQRNKTEKLIIVMDEFPYMVEGNTSIPSVLQKVWDHKLSELNIMIIISGSSMSFIENEVLSEKNPLYGRTTGLLKINELKFKEARKFLGKGNLNLHMTYYSIFSGVPYYLSLINTKESLEYNIKYNILKNGAILFNEVEFLLKQELREVRHYNAIIESIALGDTKLNEIYQKTGIEKTKLPYYINSLIDLGIIKKEYPVTVKIKEQAKKRSGLYKIDNSYFRFYYAFIYPYISELMEGNEDVILEDIILEQLSMFVSQTFEDVSIEIIRELGKERKLSIRPIKIGRWWYKDNEIDLMAYDINQKYIFGECKWRNKKIGLDVLEHLKRKVETIDLEIKEYSFALFSKSGFTEQLKEFVEESNDIILVNFSGEEIEYFNLKNALE